MLWHSRFGIPAGVQEAASAAKVRHHWGSRLLWQSRIDICGEPGVCFDSQGSVPLQGLEEAVTGQHPSGGQRRLLGQSRVSTPVGSFAGYIVDLPRATLIFLMWVHNSFSENIKFFAMILGSLCAFEKKKTVELGTLNFLHRKVSNTVPTNDIIQLMTS